MTELEADLLVKGGMVVSGRAVFRADIVVRNGKVAELSPDLSLRPASRTIDAKGKYVLPGAIDCHAHPVYQDKMDDFSICAAFGGVTTIMAFVGNFKNWGFAGYTPDIVRQFIRESEAISCLDFSVHAAFQGTDDPEKSLPELIEMGVSSFKMFMTHRRRGRMMPDEKMLRVMEMAASLGGLAMVHAENGCCQDYLLDKFMAEGKTSPEYFLKSQPNISEAEALFRAGVYAGITGCPLYGVHLSAKESLPILRLLREQGYTIYGETCPQYLTLTNDEVLRKGALGKTGPPLRGQADLEALWKAVAEGTLQTIGSDSAGFTVAQKQTGGQSTEHFLNIREHPTQMRDIFDARFGFNTIQYMVPVVFTEGVQKGRITLPRLVQLFCENPAKIFGMYPRKGTLEPGSDADLVIWDPSKTATATAKEQKGNTDWTPFEGFELQGMPVLTMQRGEVIVENNKWVGERGRGQFIHRSPRKAAYAPKGRAAV